MVRRNDIDGIRAIAVGLVVLCHAQVAGFAGGWIGVDVFFVLSGYLITRILLNEQKKGGFRMVSFMQRRLNRLAPAFFVTSIVSLVFFALFLPFLFLKPAATTLKWAAFGLANFQQAKAESYFSEGGYLNPYTHLWSLGVEEQFYLLFPLVVTLLGSVHRKYAIFLLLAAASYIALLIQLPQGGAYFWPWTRAWGLLMGAALAAYQHTTEKNVFGDWAGWVGVPVILLASALGNETGAYWHVFSLAAGLGTVLAVGSTGEGFGKWLSHPWIVAVGLASYSLYLVHQPVLVAARAWNGGYGLDAAGTVFAIGLILILGFALRAWVEVPYLKGRVQMTFVRGASIYLSLGLLSMWVAYGHLNPYRTSLAQLWGGGVDVSVRLETNFGGENAKLLPQDVAITEGTSRVYLWGDSHAMHIARALESAGVPYTQRTKSACPPSDGIASYAVHGKAYNDKEWAIQCAAFNKDTLEEIRSQPEPGVVVLVSLTWMTHNGDGILFDGEDSTEHKATSPQENMELALGGAVNSLRRAGWKIVTVSPNLFVEENPGRCNALMIWMGRDLAAQCAFAANNTNDFATYTLLETTLQSYADRELTEHVSILDTVCPDGLCIPYRDGVLIWRDKGHLSKEGSSWLGKQPDFARAIRKAIGIAEPIDAALETIKHDR